MRWAEEKFGKETRNLFVRMLEVAGIVGTFDVIVDEPVHGTPAKARTIRFTYKPLGASDIFLLHVNWQGSLPDSAFDGHILYDGDLKEMFERLKSVFKKQVFVESAHTGIVSKNSTELKDVMPSLLLDLCAEAEKHSSNRIPRAVVDQLAAPHVHGLHQEESFADYLERKGYLTLVDLRPGPTQMLEVTRQAFAALGMPCPESIVAEESTTLAPVAVASVAAPSAQSISSFMSELRELTAFLKRQDELKDELRRLTKRRDDTQGIRERALEEAKKLMAKSDDMARIQEEIQLELDAVQSGIDEDKAAEAAKTLQEFKTLMTSLPG
jgi:hypothetical protein